MNIRVVGLGYAGAVAGAALAKAGHNVLGVDISRDKIVAFKQGVRPFYEPDLAGDETAA